VIWPIRLVQVETLCLHVLTCMCLLECVYLNMFALMRLTASVWSSYKNKNITRSQTKLIVQRDLSAKWAAKLRKRVHR